MAFIQPCRSVALLVCKPCSSLASKSFPLKSLAAPCRSTFSLAPASSTSSSLTAASSTPHAATSNLSGTSPSSKSSIRGLRLGLLGAPGVGKGTYASRLGPHFSIPFISTGDLVRAEIKLKSPLGEQIRAVNNAGGLVPDDIITKMLRTRLSGSDCSDGFILDGYPRRLTQAKMLENFCQLDVVLNIELREDLLVRKTMARRVCAKCGYNYNICSINENHGEYLMPPLLPKKEDECDRCHHKPLQLVQRADDEEEIVRHRLRLYHQETKPLEEYYRKRGILTVHHVKKGVADVPQMIQNLENFIHTTRK